MVTTQDTSGENDHESLQGRQAEELFPDFFQQPAKKEYEGPAFPQPPGDSWLKIDGPDGREDTGGLHALLLLREVSQQSLIGMKLQQMGYIITVVQSAGQAMDELRTTPYQLIVCGADTAYRDFHEYLRLSVPQQRRRMLYYVLIGSQLHTCYDLQALALSANLVINERELPFFEVILRKGFQEYVKLFGPFLEAIGETSLPVLT